MAGLTCPIISVFTYVQLIVPRLFLGDKKKPSNFTEETLSVNKWISPMTKDNSVVFYVLVVLLLGSCSYSVFELAQNMSQIGKISIGDAISIVLKSFGSSAGISLIGSVVALILIAINIITSIVTAKHSTSGKVVSGLLRVPANTLLLVVSLWSGYMIYVEYFYTQMINPLSGSMLVDIISAGSAFVLMFVRKF